VVPIIPLLAPLLQIMFLGSLALLLFGVWAGAIPPAWSTGRAEPWPGRQPAQRRRAPQPAPQPTGTAQPAATRRKRKKRH
jgi:hypothetical protein